VRDAEQGHFFVQSFASLEILFIVILLLLSGDTDSATTTTMMMTLLTMGFFPVEMCNEMIPLLLTRSDDEPSSRARGKGLRQSTAERRARRVVLMRRKRAETVV
jgi:hypothetical protein